MTFEEMLQLANNGNVQAMYDVGTSLFEHYNNLNQPGKAIEEAVKWYERAADNGHEQAAYMAIVMIETTMRAKKRDHHLDLAYEDSNIIIRYAKQFIMNQTYPSEIRSTVKVKLANALYVAAAYWYANQQPDQAIQYLNILDSLDQFFPMASILHGLCLDDPQTAIQMFKVLDAGIANVLPKDYDDIDQGIIIGAIIMLAGYYRIVEQNLGKAYALLSEGVSILDPAVSEDLQEELSCYHKTVFGGHQYIER